MASPSPVSVEELLVHSQWLRRLARRLVEDVHAADDLVQATWQAALQGRPRHGGNLRGWLQRILRRLAAAERRRSDRQARREHRVEAKAADPAAEELVEQADLQRHLVALVTQLPEPGRSTVLLHFFWDLSPAAIARRQGIPASTVRNRLKRALDALRAQLDDDHRQGRRQWMALLAPLAVAGRPASRSIIVPITVAAAAIALVAVAARLIWRPSAAQRVDSVAGRLAAPAGDAAEGGQGAARDGDAVTPGRVPVATVNAPADEAAAPPSWGMVVDARGRAVGGVRVVFAPHETTAPQSQARQMPDDQTLAKSDADGVFRWHAAAAHGRLEVRSERWTTVLAARHDRVSRGLPTAVVVAPRAPVAGRVTDGSGHAVAGAVVRLALPKELRARVGIVLDAAEERVWESATNADGRFAFADAPEVAGLRASCRAVGHAPWSGAASTDLPITLARFDAADTTTIRGRVVDDADHAVGDAKVSLAGRDTWTDADGSFALPVEQPLPDSARLVAIKDGGGFATARDPQPDEFVTLRLARQVIYTGRVRTADGAPVAGASVQLTPRLTAIGVKAATTTEVRRAPTPGGLRAGPVLRLASVTTDAAGAFEIVAPEFESGRLTAVDFTSLRRASVPVGAKRQGLEIVFPRDRLRRLRGAVVDQRGQAVAGVRVTAQRTLQPSLTAGARISLGSRESTTDAHGRFAFDRLTDADIRLFASAPGVLPTWTTVGATDADVTLRLVRAGHVRVVTEPAADEVAFVDDDGEPMAIATFAGHLLRTNVRRAPLFDGQSSVHRVPLNAAAVVVYRHDQEIRRRPVSIRGGRLNVVRP
ncbi:MAG: sigma-70 family RNA polymerase sigma factor [Planctomycetota bacterium]